jgi:hypothetical protein
MGGLGWSSPLSLLRSYGGHPSRCQWNVLGLPSEARLKGERRMAGSTGLEPAASAVTGQRSNQLNYDPNTAMLAIEELVDGESVIGHHQFATSWIRQLVWAVQDSNL